MQSEKLEIWAFTVKIVSFKRFRIALSVLISQLYSPEECAPVKISEIN
jgi:hypothetical protein